MPIKATPPINQNAAEKLPVSCTIQPITIGVMIPPILAARLVIPPVRPISSLGATSDTAAQDADAMPWAKNAVVNTAMHSTLESVKLTSTIDIPSIEPTTNGSLRANDSE